jgi:LacI family transcriptional regulator
MATIYQVSELAGVSLATVSRVMNGNAKVSDKTREKVLAAMKELGYRPNSIAQSLASSRGNSIGLLVSELNGAFFGEMMAGVENELRNAGKHIIVTTGHSIEEKEKEGIEFLISRNCDAIILHVEAVSDEYLIALSKGKTPIFIISRYVEELSDHCISLDNELGGYLATKTLLDLGHTDIACIAGPQYKYDAKARFNGYKRALAEHNVTFDENLFYVADFKETGGSEGISHLMEHQRKFSALVCGNDEMASGAMTFAREQGLSLPNDLSVIGFDNVIFAPYIHPKLTTILNPVNEMGRMAAKLVLKQVYQRSDESIQQVFKPTLIARDSAKEYQVQP